MHQKSYFVDHHCKVNIFETFQLILKQTWRLGVFIAMASLVGTHHVRAPHSKGIFLLIFTKLSAFLPLEKIQADEKVIRQNLCQAKQNEQISRLH